MSAHALLYGATELKQVAQRNWTLGFMLSLLVHLCMLAAYLLTGPYDVSELKFPPRRPSNPVLDITSPGPINGAVAPHPATAGPRAAVKKGTPVPVAEHEMPATAEVVPGTGGHDEGALPGSIRDGGNPDGVFVVDEVEPEPFVPVEKPPQVIISALPVYPAVAMKAGLEGKVWVNIWVDREGKVKKAVVVKSTGEIFNEAAIESAVKFVFTPAFMNGGPVAVWVVVPFAFRLR